MFQSNSDTLSITSIFKTNVFQKIRTFSLLLNQFINFINGATLCIQSRVIEGKVTMRTESLWQMTFTCAVRGGCYFPVSPADIESMKAC